MSDYIWDIRLDLIATCRMIKNANYKDYTKKELIKELENIKADLSMTIQEIDNYRGYE